MSFFLRTDSESVRNRIKDGEWTITDLDKVISYAEDCETYLKKEDPDWKVSDITIPYMK